MRPTVLHVGGTLYWELPTFDPDNPGVLKDADSTPTVTVRKNGAATSDSVTVTKRAASTGLYDCTYNPASEIETDSFQISETMVMTGSTTAQKTYHNSFPVTVLGTATLYSELLSQEISSGDWDWPIAIEVINAAVLAALPETLTGPFTRTITVTDADTNDPIEGARVRLYRTGETETVETNASGVASFTVEAATWSYAITASGYTGVSGTVMVSANGDTAVEMEAVSTTPPTNPDLSAIAVLCLDAAGQPEADVEIDIRITAIPSGSQNTAFKGAKQTATSDADGIARFEVVQGSTCEWKRGRADVWSSVVIDSDGVTNVTSVIGSP